MCRANIERGRKKEGKREERDMSLCVRYVYVYMCFYSRYGNTLINARVDTRYGR